MQNRVILTFLADLPLLWEQWILFCSDHSCIQEGAEHAAACKHHYPKHSLRNSSLKAKPDLFIRRKQGKVETPHEPSSARFHPSIPSPDGSSSFHLPEQGAQLGFHAAFALSLLNTVFPVAQVSL